MSSQFSEFRWAYIICIDINTPEGDYSKLIAEIQKSINWWHYLKTTWIVIRSETLVELGNKLRATIYPNDRLLVMPAKGPADGYLPQDAWDWIYRNVPREW